MGEAPEIHLQVSSTILTRKLDEEQGESENSDISDHVREYNMLSAPLPHCRHIGEANLLVTSDERHAQVQGSSGNDTIQ